MRRRLSYANVAATVALVFSMSGGALAASHYLVTSTKQIKPSVLKKLRGKTGPRGATGATGPAGATGAAGVEGPKGVPGLSALSTLPSGQTESGDYGIRVDSPEKSGFIDTAVTFPVPLGAVVPATNVVYVTGHTAIHCSGVGHADPGYLCIYSGHTVGLSAPEVDDYEGTIKAGTGMYGFDMEWTVSEGHGYDFGTYSVTAP